MAEAFVQERFAQELARVHRAARLRVALHGAIATLAVGGLAFGAAAWAVGGDVEPSPGPRAWMLAAAALLTLMVARARLWVPLRALRDRAALSAALDRDGALHNLVVAAEEAARRPDRWGPAAGVPAVLAGRLFAAAERALGSLRLGRRLPLPRAGLALAGFAAAAAGLLALATTDAARLERGSGRLIHPWRPDAPPPEVGLYLGDNPAVVVAGADAVFAARDFGRARTGVTCEVRVGSALWRRVETRRERGAGGSFDLWVARVPQARESFAYRFGRDGMLTREGRIEVVHPPLLAAWGGRLRPPAYTRLPEQVVAQLPARLQAPVGSTLAWEGRAGGHVDLAAVVTAGGDSVALDARGDTLRGSTRLDSSLAYVVALRDARGLENAPRLTYAVDVVPDAAPVATLARPDDDGRLPAEGAVLLVAGASDDWGVSRVDLLLRRESGGDGPAPAAADEGAGHDAGWSRVTLWPRPAGGGASPEELPVDTPWGATALRTGEAAGPAPAGPFTLPVALEATRLDLLPGDALAVCVEAFDNRAPGPPGRGRSAVVRLVLPSAADLLAEQVGEGEERAETLAELRRRGEELGRELGDLDRELKKNPAPDWEKQQQLQSALERQRALQEEFRSVADELQRDVERLAQENLASVSLLEKMQQVSDLLAQVRNDELDRMLAELRERAGQLSPEQVRAAMEEVARNRQEYEERLDRAIGLLRELAREQQMQGLTSVAERLLREQQALLDAARADSARDGASREEAARREQAQRQSALADEARRLEARLQEALARLEQESRDDAGAPAAPSAAEMRKALAEALRRLAESRPDSAMDEAASRLGAPPPASPPPDAAQQRALRELAALYHVLLSGQLGMQSAMEQYAAVNLRRLAGDLLALSQREEEIAGRVPADLRGVDAGELTRAQHRVLKATRSVQSRLQELGARSPAVTARLLRDVGQLAESLDATVRAFELGVGDAARRQALDALGAMNRIVIGLLTAAQQAGGGGGGGMPMPSASEQLQRMAREQAGLNGLADQLMNQLRQRGMSEEVRAQMRRLESGQGDLAGRLEQLEQERRAREGGERILGDLDDLARQMERVADDLGAGRLDDGTLARQERILSRLLDAHNSVRKRDFAQRRESRSARQPFAPQSGERAPVADAGDADPYRRRREPVEKAPADYRDLVRRYFRALDELSSGGDRAGPAVPEAGGAR